LQACCHWQFPNVSHTRARLHCDVPSGGSEGGFTGAIEGEVTGHAAGGQIGGKSIEF
jgi:hypothetical protein